MQQTRDGVFPSRAGHWRAQSVGKTHPGDSTTRLGPTPRKPAIFPFWGRSVLKSPPPGDALRNEDFPSFPSRTRGQEVSQTPLQQLQSCRFPAQPIWWPRGKTDSRICNAQGEAAARALKQRIKFEFKPISGERRSLNAEEAAGNEPTHPEATQPSFPRAPRPGDSPEQFAVGFFLYLLLRARTRGPGAPSQSTRVTFLRGNWTGCFLPNPSPSANPPLSAASRKPPLIPKFSPYLQQALKPSPSLPPALAAH